MNENIKNSLEQFIYHLMYETKKGKIKNEKNKI